MKRTVTITVELPDSIADRVGEIQAEKDGLLSDIIHFGVMRYDVLRAHRELVARKQAGVTTHA